MRPGCSTARLPGSRTKHLSYCGKAKPSTRHKRDRCCPPQPPPPSTLNPPPPTHHHPHPRPPQVEAAQLVSTVASAAEGYPFVPPAYLPSVLVPTVGLILPAIGMGWVSAAVDGTFDGIGLGCIAAAADVASGWSLVGVVCWAKARVWPRAAMQPLLVHSSAQLLACSCVLRAVPRGSRASLSQTPCPGSILSGDPPIVRPRQSGGDRHPAPPTAQRLAPTAPVYTHTTAHMPFLSPLHHEPRPKP
jgi:hypothetical protein